MSNKEIQNFKRTGKDLQGQAVTTVVVNHDASGTANVATSSRTDTDTQQGKKKMISIFGILVGAQKVLLIRVKRTWLMPNWLLIMRSL